MHSTRRLWFPILLGVIGMCWMLLTPPGAAADEPVHLIRAGAVIRGQFSGEAGPDTDYSDAGEVVTVPDSVVVPDHNCYATIANRTTSVNCAPKVDYRGEDVVLVTTADDYPVWGHLVYGLGTLVPGIASVWPARLIGVVVAFGLIGVAVGRARTRWQTASIVAALTPMVFGTIAAVNPSTFAIAGAIAMWTVLWYRPEGALAPTDQWLFALGWLAVADTRRDGLVWASIIVTMSLVMTNRSAPRWFARLNRGPLITVVVGAGAQALWGLSTGSRLLVVGAFSPLIIVAGEVVRTVWNRQTTRVGRTGVALATALVAVAATGVTLVARPGGWNTALALRVAAEGTDHVLQAIGVLGWLGIYLPDAALFFAVITFGAMIGIALMERPAAALASLAVLLTAVGTAWWFEMMSGADYGQYWQGRYSLPLLVGVPIILGTVPLARPRERQLSTALVAASLGVVNVAAWAAARRWGVGTEGSYLPWNWSTIHQPVPPVLLLIVMAAASIVIVGQIDARTRAA